MFNSKVHYLIHRFNVQQTVTSTIFRKVNQKKKKKKESAIYDDSKINNTTQRKRNQKIITAVGSH